MPSSPGAASCTVNRPGLAFRGRKHDNGRSCQRFNPESSTMKRLKLPPPHARLALLAVVLVAMVTTATPAMAQCTVKDIQISKALPSGNPNRGSNSNLLIQSQLPSTGPVATRPLDFCAVVWDSSGGREGHPCEENYGSANSHVGNATGGGLGSMAFC